MPIWRTYAGKDRAAVVRALREGRTANDDGPARLVVVARDEAHLRERRAEGERLLSADPALWRDGLYFREAPIGGELAFVFGGAAGAYAGIGRRDPVRVPRDPGRPGLTLSERGRRGRVGIRGATPADSPTPSETLWGTAFVAQAHAAVSRDVLGLQPQAAIGFSAGETNALFALGAWDDLAGFYRDFEESELFTRWVGGPFEAVRRAWGANSDPISWHLWRVLASEDDVTAALAEEPRAEPDHRERPG